MPRTSRAAPAAANSAWLPWACWLGLFVALLFVYGPALRGDFLWDDHGHVTRTDLQSLDGLVRIWFEIGATQQYYPVLHSAFWLEHHLWGDATVGYHLLNVALHAGSAVLFALVLFRLQVPGGWLAALLFAFHPVAVESVAWIAEQKNTLSTFFYLIAFLAYLRFVAARRPATYVLATTFFLLALLTKTVTATLPAALLVVFWWQRGRLEWRRDVLPLLPWFVAGTAAGLFTAHFEKELIGAQGADFALSFLDRVVLAGRVFWFYLGKLVWPANFIFIYPRWTVDAAQVWQWAFPLAGVVLLGALAWWSRRSRGPLAAALLFGGTLFPVLGFFDVYPFRFSYVADHFQYLACLAVFALIGALAARLTPRFSSTARFAAVSVLAVGLGVLSHAQSRIYRDVFVLYETTIARNPTCWMAHNNLATELTAAGRVAEAIPHLERTLELKPDYPEALSNLGDDYVQLDRPAKAIPLLERAIQLQPKFARAHRNLGLALATSGKTEEAIARFAEAARLDPHDADAELQWGIGLMLTKRFPEGVPHFDNAVRLAPESARVHLMYGMALAHNGRAPDAVAKLTRALELDPDLAEAHLNLAQVLSQLGRTPEAGDHYRRAVELDPSLAKRR